MSQIDKVHFFPTLVWVLFGYLFWYVFVLVFFVPKYYKVLRSRYYLEVFLIERVNNMLIVLELKNRYFFVWKKLFLNNFFLRIYLKIFVKKLEIIHKIKLI